MSKDFILSDKDLIIIAQSCMKLIFDKDPESVFTDKDGVTVTSETTKQALRSLMLTEIDTAIKVKKDLESIKKTNKL